MRSPPIIVQHTSGQICETITIFNSIYIRQRHKIKVKNSLHWLKLDIIHKVVNHSLNNEWAIDVRASDSAKHNDTAILVLDIKCTIYWRKVNRLSLIFGK
jgi:hypothetical protein